MQPSEPSQENITEITDLEFHPFFMVHRAIHNVGLKPGPAWLYCCLKDYGNRSNVCFAGFDKIIERAGISRRHFFDCLNVLEEARMIERAGSRIILTKPSAWICKLPPTLGQSVSAGGALKTESAGGALKTESAGGALMSAGGALAILPLEEDRNKREFLTESETVLELPQAVTRCADAQNLPLDKSKECPTKKLEHPLFKKLLIEPNANMPATLVGLKSDQGVAPQRSLTVNTAKPSAMPSSDEPMAKGANGTVLNDDKAQSNVLTLAPSAELISVTGQNQKPKPENTTTLVWNEYAQQVQKRWGVAPQRSAKVNTLLKGLIADHGLEIALKMPAWYLGDNDKFVVQKCHPVGLMVSNAQKYAIENAIGVRITHQRADRVARAADVDDVFSEIDFKKKLLPLESDPFEALYAEEDAKTERYRQEKLLRLNKGN